MIKTLKANKLIGFFIILFLIIFISSPSIYMKSCINGLNIWFFNVLPALFPFFIATRLLILLDINEIPILNKLTKKFFKVNNGGKIFFLSLISGYPIGAKMICDSYKNNQIDQVSAKRMLSFCSVSGPMFIIGSIGIAVFKSVKIGYILLICHIIGALINGLVFRNCYKKNQEEKLPDFKPLTKSKNILADSMLDSINSILLVGGYIVFAYVLIDLFNNLNIIPTIANFISILPCFKGQVSSITSFLNGILEMTRGLVDIGSINLNKTILLPVSSFLLGFGGISVFMQSLNFTKELEIRKSFYFFQKFCQGLWSLLIAIIFSLIFF